MDMRHVALAAWEPWLPAPGLREERHPQPGSGGSGAIGAGAHRLDCRRPAGGGAESGTAERRRAARRRKAAGPAVSCGIGAAAGAGPDLRYLPGRGLACILILWDCHDDGLRRGFHADKSGGGEERNGNQKSGKKGAAATGGKGLAETGFVQKTFDALGEMTGAGHGNSCKGWAREGREFKQELSVGGAAGGLFKAGAVADGLAQFREFAFEPPSQWAEPEQGGVEAGEQLQIEVALADVRALVRQNHAHLLLIPIGVIGG